MNSIDTLKLLAGLPITMSDNSCSVFPALLRDIAEIGTSTFFQYLNLLTLNSEDISSMVNLKIKPFDFLFYNATQNDSFKTTFLDSLKFFIREEFLMVDEQGILIIGDFAEGRILSSQNFEEFQTIIKAQNFLEEDIVKYTGEDEIARKIKERVKKGQEKIEKLKNKREENAIQFSDIVASLTINSSLNIVDIWNISYYTLNDQFKRMRYLEEYNTGLQSIMAGADPKKIKLKDWIRSIQK